LISKKIKNSKLAAITTCSALGKSSLYSRLKLDGISYFCSVGFTSGFGHFHIPQDIFKKMRKYLNLINHPYANGHNFGTGPNWRLRTIRTCLNELNMSEDILKHNFRREVFICPLAVNYQNILTGKSKRANWDELKSVDAVSNLALERWVIKRSKSTFNWHTWTKDDTFKQMQLL